MNGIILKSIAGTLILGLALFGPGAGLAMAQVAELADLREWDPGFHAAMEALVEADPEMNDLELRGMCIDLALDARTNPGVQADLAREAEVMSRQGVDPRTAVPEEVRAKTQEIYTQWKGEMSAKMEQLRRTDPEGARKLEFQLREGERQMTAFRGGERYVPSPEMRAHAQETFNQWEKDALQQGMSKEALTAARREFERWGDPRGMGRMPQNVHYDQQGKLMVMDPQTRTSRPWDPATMGPPPGGLALEGGMGRMPAGWHYNEKGQLMVGDKPWTPEMGPAPITNTDSRFSGGAATGWRSGTYDAGAGNRFAKELGVTGNLNDPSKIRELLDAGKITDADLDQMWAQGDVRLREGIMAVRGGDRGFGGGPEVQRGWEQGGTWAPPPGDPATWAPEVRAAWEAGAAARTMRGGSNYGINPSTGGWEPNMGGTGTPYPGGGGGWSSGGGTTYGGTDWSAGGGTTYGGTDWSAGGGTTYGDGGNWGVNPATGGWEPNMGGGTTYSGGGSYYTSDTSGTTYNHNYDTSQEGQHGCSGFTAEDKSAHQAHGHCPNE